ncbi:hypothetical protein KUTeg_020693 [Tegillarca granosa]|uniref:ER membrane protein complex subunit 3 n=1 Tax=Tegillarca granosa TaxID=220873 RepID=A0ABQ9ED09_TEGGR|nr:hypothetical protein KUTeg_020693 [Tegillarca granosa]
MAELLLDSNIRFWVFLPIVVITFFTGIIRHYVTILLSSEKKSELQQVSDSHALIRSRILRENGKYIPKQGFIMRKNFFNNDNDGFFKTAKREAAAKNPMTDPSMMTDMLKGNVTNVLPMIVIGGWINWAFSGFLTTADQTKAMQEQMSGSGMMAPPDPMKAFKAEWEALEVCNHQWCLQGVEEELIDGHIQPETIYIKNKYA